MRMLLSRFQEEIVKKYNLKEVAVDGWVYIEIRKWMYGFKQAGLLANQLLQKSLAPFGYYPARHTPCIWLHKTRPISFSLIVDDRIVMGYCFHLPHTMFLRHTLVDSMCVMHVMGGLGQHVGIYVMLP
jgi:hypothetical protein